MNATHDDIRKALRVLGYERTQCFEDEWYEIDFEQPEYMAPPMPVQRPIPIDLASLLRRCSSERTYAKIEANSVGTFDAIAGAGFEAEHADPTTALILALAAMGEKENGNG